MAMVGWKVIILAILAVVGVVLIIIGGALIPYFNNRYQQYITEKFSLQSKDTDGYKTWLSDEMSRDTYHMFYVFNVTNHDDVMKRNRTPHVEEIGPFTYRVNATRVGAHIDPTGKELTYAQSEGYEFVPSLSAENDSISIITVNIPIVALAMRLRYYNENVTSAVNAELHNISDEKLFTSVTVSDLIWGYESDGLRRTNIFIQQYFNISVFNDTTFGLAYKSGQAKRTKTEQFTISTGSDDLDTVKDIIAWNNQSHLNYWTTKYSNEINGTDSTGWHPFIKKFTQPYGFNSDWCRSLYFYFHNLSHSRSITTWRYTMPPSVLEFNRNNSGFCVPTSHCPYHGVLNTTACKDNYPILVSQPHFYKGSWKYQRAVTGLTSNSSQHVTSIEIEPITGDVVESHRKIQYNLDIQNSSAFNDTARFQKRIIFPVAWKQVSYNMSSGDLDRLKTKLHDIQWTRTLYEGIPYGLIVLGGVILILFFILLIVYCLLRKSGNSQTAAGERQPLLT